MYELAFHLGMPVYRLLDEMPYEEFLGWYQYFNQRPLGWREDLRAGMMIKAQGVQGNKIDITALFPSLKNAGKSDSTMDSFKSSSVRNHLLKAVGGDKLDFI